MHRPFSKIKRVQRTAILVLSTFLLVSAGRAQEHVTPLSEIHRALRASASTQQQNLGEIQTFFSQEKVRDVLKLNGMDAAKLSRGASLLSEQDQANLAAKVRSANQDLAAGELNSGQTTLIIVAVALFAAMVVLVIAFQ